MLESRHLEDLVPVVRSMAVSFIALAENTIEGLKIIVTCTRRDAERQDALFAIGRRNIAGEKIVTNCKGGESYHEFGVAFDIFPMLFGKPVMMQQDGDQVSDPIWQTLGEIGESCGLEWAGRWKHFPEGPHFQFTGGLNLAELKSGNRPT